MEDYKWRNCRSAVLVFLPQNSISRQNKIKSPFPGYLSTALLLCKNRGCSKSLPDVSYMTFKNKGNVTYII